MYIKYSPQVRKGTWRAQHQAAAATTGCYAKKGVSARQSAKAEAVLAVP